MSLKPMWPLPLKAVQLAGALLSVALAVALEQPARATDLGQLAQLRDEKTQRASSCNPDWRNGSRDSVVVQPGETFTFADLTGPGEIRHIWLTIAAKERGYSRLLSLRAYWDDEKEPSVLAPLGDFFAVGHGVDAPVDSLVVKNSTDGRGRNSYWPMPFAKRARLQLTNEGTTEIIFFYIVDWALLPSLPANTAYFHASYRQEFPAKSGTNYLIADIAGRGHYVGTLLSCRQIGAGWWGEGDDFFFIDGAKEPQIRGTGTEDYFGQSWGLTPDRGLYFGAPIADGNMPYGRSSAYRWHIPDPVCFEQSLKVEIEHKGEVTNPNGTIRSGFEERPDELSSVAFWYQTEPHKPLSKLPSAYLRLDCDYRKTVQAESIIKSLKATKGALTAEKRGGLSNWQQVVWRPTGAGEELSFPIKIDSKGRLRLTLLMSVGPDYGSFNVSLGNVRLAQRIDLYNPFYGNRDLPFDLAGMAEGTYTVRIRNAGKNPMSSGYNLGFDGYVSEAQ